jgi:two-component system OmpR family sensor kinase
MSRTRVALPIFLQIALLVAVSTALAMAVCFAMVLHAPPPPTPGFTLDQAVRALGGEAVRTEEGPILRRSVSATSPLPADTASDPLAGVIGVALSRQLAVEPDAVRVRVLGRDGEPAAAMRVPGGARWTMRDHAGPDQDRQTRTIVIHRSSASAPDDAPPPPVSPPPPGPSAARPRLEILTEDVRGPLEIEAHRQITVSTDGLRFPPFTASLRLADGQWATVSPPTGAWSPWHTRILLTFGASLALLAPLTWFMARRLARPVRLFAQAAERLGSDPHAPPLEATGPAEVRAAAQAFNDMQTKLNRYVEGRTQMVAAIAHDLRTPLTRLRFRAEQADPEIRDRMTGDIEEMDRLISQALSYVRGETLREARADLDLTALVASVVADLKEIGADVALDAAEAVPVEGEALNLRRAVSNLIENAVKFAGAAEVTVAAEAGLAVVTVSDTGPGLPPEELETVFEPFHRGEKSRNRDTGGAGLGLAVARGVARAHGGDVTLANREGGGLEARLTLPLS